ncbi:MAG: flagellar protein FlaG [Brevundimonas sp.]|nr:flagellar protein FlaG [Brevundimonas sp.]
MVIEQSARKGVFIYKVLDRETGEVVRQLPREEVARLGSHKGYAPGTVINTSL